VRILRDPKLFTNLAGNLCIVTLNNSISKHGTVLSIDLMNNFGKLKFFDSVSSFLLPGLKPSRLPIIVSSGHKELGSDKNDLLIQTEHSAVVESAFVNDRHANITKQIHGKLRVPQNICQHLPAVPNRV